MTLRFDDYRVILAGVSRSEQPPTDRCRAEPSPLRISRRQLGGEPCTVRGEARKRRRVAGFERRSPRLLVLYGRALVRVFAHSSRDLCSASRTRVLRASPFGLAG